MAVVTGFAAAALITDGILILVERLAKMQELREKAKADPEATFDDEAIKAYTAGNAAAHDGVQSAFDETYGDGTPDPAG